MAQINSTELDFEQIKANLRNFFRNSASSAYRDWDYEGSGLSTLIDVLAYSTHYNAMLAHMSVNETFLDSAQLRKNVVSHAKLLGYVPHSSRASFAGLIVQFPSSSMPTLEMPRGTQFSASIDGVAYTFVTLQTYTAPAFEGFYTFGTETSPVLVYQGVLKRVSFVVDENQANQRFVIADTSVDLSSLRVTIRENAQSSIEETFVSFSSLGQTDETSPIYFIAENSGGRYELTFGDGIFGKKLKSMSSVQIEFLSTLGGDANSANDFTLSGSLDGLSASSVETVYAASSGGPRESIESVKFNAPLALIAQNRAVTAEDYKAIILKEFGAVDAINVWGGETQPVPEYGRVFISIKPLDFPTLTLAEKNQIMSILKKKNVLTITPVMVDPDYVYLSIDVLFKYNPNKTSKSAGELSAVIKNVITSFNDSELRRFDGVFRFSKFLRAIDLSDTSIVNSAARVFLYKEVLLTDTVAGSTAFSAKLDGMPDETRNLVSSTSFSVGGDVCYVGDEPLSSAQRRLYVYKLVGGIQVKVVYNAGYIKIADGTVVLSDFTVDSPTTIKLRITPATYDLAPLRNQLLNIDLNETTISGEIDTIVVGGSSGASAYQPFGKNR